MSDLKEMPVVTVEQVNRFRDAAIAAIEQSSKEIERLNALVSMQAEALYASKMFIRNGVALGFIRMPDDDCPDPAKDTLPTVENALSASSSTVAKWEAEHAAKVLEDFIKTLRALPSIGLSERQFGELERATKVKE